MKNPDFSKPDYGRIYKDIIQQKHPEKKHLLEQITSKNSFNALDIMSVNTQIFGCPKEASKNINKRFRSYDIFAITRIIRYQKKHELSNTETARLFQVSRNTICNWKKKYTIV